MNRRKAWAVLTIFIILLLVVGLWQATRFLIKPSKSADSPFTKASKPAEEPLPKKSAAKLADHPAEPTHEGSKVVGLRESRSTEIQGIVLDSADQPVGGARVTLWKMPEGWSLPGGLPPDLSPNQPVAVVQTSTDGTFHSGPIEGTTALMVMASKEKVGRASRWDVPAGAYVSLSLAGSAVIAGTVQRLEGADSKIAVSVAVSKTGGDFAPFGSEFLAGAWINEDGTYEIQGVPAGTAVVAIQSEEFSSSWKRVQVEAGKVHTVDFTLESGEAIQGKVLDEEGSGPIAGARVGIKNSSLKQTRTDPEGGFVLKGIPNRSERIVTILEVSAQGFTPRQFNLGNVDEEQVIALHRGLRVQGLVLDARTQTPIPGVEITACQRVREPTIQFGKSPIWRRALTDADGRFTVNDMSSGSKTLEMLLKKNGYGFKILSFQELAPSSLNGDDHGPEYSLPNIELSSAAVIDGRCIDSGGAPVPGATLTIWPTDAIIVGSSGSAVQPYRKESIDLYLVTTSGAQGEFSAEVNAGETYKVKASGDGYRDQDMELLVAQGGINLEIELQGDKLEPITISVVDEWGTPVPAARLIVEFGSGFRAGKSDQEGAWKTTCASSGSVGIQASKDGFIQATKDYALSEGNGSIQMTLIGSGQITAYFKKMPDPARKVNLARSEEPGKVLRTCTKPNADGQFEFETLPPGKYIIWVDDNESEATSLEIEPGSINPTRVEIVGSKE